MATRIDEWLCGGSGSGPPTYPASADPADGVSIGSVLRRIFDAQVGSAGVATYPSANAPANAVSMAEVLREIYDLSEKSTVNTAVALTGGTVADVFTVAGGPILVLGLWVQITTAVSANACAINFQSDPTAGASNTDLCEGTGGADLTGLAIGSIVALNGDSQDIMRLCAVGTDLPVMENQNGGVFVPIGGIDMILANSDPTTGIADITIMYKPCARGVTVT